MVAASFCRQLPEDRFRMHYSNLAHTHTQTNKQTNCHLMPSNQNAVHRASILLYLLPCAVLIATFLLAKAVET